MDFRASALDIQELVVAFAEMEGTELSQMKDLWRRRNFSFIHEARPKDVIPSFYSQALFSSALSHVVAEDASLVWKLGGLYVLYTLYETQQRENACKIYLSLEELDAIFNLVKKIKQKQLLVAFKVVQTMFAKNMFLFGSVSANQKRIAASMDKVARQTALSVQQARSRLLTNVPMWEHVEGDLANGFGLDRLAELTRDYSVSKKRALSGKQTGDLSSSVGHSKDVEVSVGDELKKDIEAWEAKKFEWLNSARQATRDLLSKARKVGAPLKEGKIKTISEYEKELQCGASTHDGDEDSTLQYERELDEQMEEELDRALELELGEKMSPGVEVRPEDVCGGGLEGG